MKAILLERILLQNHVVVRMQHVHFVCHNKPGGIPVCIDFRERNVFYITSKMVPADEQSPRSSLFQAREIAFLGICHYG